MHRGPGSGQHTKAVNQTRVEHTWETAIPPGCPYNPRCPKVFDRCPKDDPRALISSGPDGHGTACWLVDG